MADSRDYVDLARSWWLYQHQDGNIRRPKPVSYRPGSNKEVNKVLVFSSRASTFIGRICADQICIRLTRRLRIFFSCGYLGTLLTMAVMKQNPVTSKTSGGQGGVLA